MLDFPTIEEAPAVEPEVASEVVDRAQIIDGTPLVKYSATEAGLATLKADLAGKTYDLTTTKGNEAARGDRLRCVTLRTTLEKRRKDFKAPALAYGKLIDTEAARITAEIEALEAPIDAQIKADEQRRAAEKAERERIEAERIERHEGFVRTIRAYLTHCQQPGMTAARIDAGMKSLAGIQIGPEREEYAVPAANARCETLEAMRVLYVQAAGREAEAARLELQRQEQARVAEEQRIERERIAAETAEIRRQAAELAAQRAESERLERLAEERRQAAAQHAERLASQQVLKAEPAVAEATDRETPATTSPRGGAMGEGQAAAAAPAADAPTLVLGEINARLGFIVTEAFMTRLGFARQVRIGKGVHYLASDWPAIKRALCKYVAELP